MEDGCEEPLAKAAWEKAGKSRWEEPLGRARLLEKSSTRRAPAVAGEERRGGRAGGSTAR